MWKNKLYILGIVLALCACNEIDEDERWVDYELPALERNVLLEEFTGQRCVNCPEGAAQAKKLQEMFDHKVIVVGIHAGGYAVGTDFVTKAGNAYWEKFYSDGDTRGYPAAMVDRDGSVSNGFQSEWTSKVIKAGMVATQYSLSMSTNYDFDTRNLTVITTLNKATELAENKTKLLLLLTESKIIDLQYSVNPPLILDYEHNHVLRGAIGDKDEIPNYWGTDVKISSLEELTVTSSSYQLNKGWVPENMNVVGIVYDADTFEVLQVEEIPLITNDN